MSLGSLLRRYWLMMIVLAGVLAFVGMHVVWYIHPSDIQSTEELRTHVTGGQPTVVEFYSNL